jgi:hypothetical protein
MKPINPKVPKCRANRSFDYANSIGPILYSTGSPVAREIALNHTSAAFAGHDLSVQGLSAGQLSKSIAIHS